MKKRILTTFTFLVSLSISAQTNVPFDFLDIGNVRARVHADGRLFEDVQNASPSYEIPKGSGNHTIYSSGFWFSTLEKRNNFPHLGASFHDFSSLFMLAGPIDIVNQRPDTSSAFNRVWKINKSQIDNHIQNWRTPTYTAPAIILNWPGNGTANTAQKLAPFEDLDQDGVYEPLDGEYPVIKGDQAVFSIFNTFSNQVSVDTLITPRLDSAGNIATDSAGNFIFDPYTSYTSMRLEAHMMVYAYISPNLDILNTTFVNLKLFNRSNRATDDHQDFKLSVFNDFDLGNPTDDYIGTDTSKQMFYVYNGDNFDEGVRGMPGYGSSLPAQGVKFLDHNIDHSMYFNIGQSATGDPVAFEHYALYQRGVWKDSSSLFFSGDGYNNCVDTTTKVDFVYSGNPSLVNDTTQWTEVNPCVVGNSSSPGNFSGDRRMIGGPELPNQFLRGEVLEINYAYIFAQSNISNVDAVNVLGVVADSVQDFYDKKLSVGLQNPPLNEIVNFKIYPNPANQLLTISTELKDFQIEIINLQGQVIQQYRNSTKINVSNFSNGIYLLRLFNENSTGVKRLVISN